MQAKGETSTLQTGKDTNIMRNIFQSSWVNDKNAFKKYIYIFQISAVRTGARAYMGENVTIFLSILYFIFKYIPSATHTPKIGTSLDSSLIKKQQSLIFQFQIIGFRSKMKKKKTDWSESLFWQDTFTRVLPVYYLNEH